MHVSLRQLRIFQTVAQHLNYTRAAEQLHLTQPAVSMQIRQLEEAIGLALFERTGRRLRLTEAGNEVRRYSREIERQLREMNETLDALKGLGRGQLRIAVASTVNYFAPRLLAAFHRRYPGIALHLDVTNRQTLLQRLETDAVDLVLMGQPPENIGVDATAFMNNPLVVIAHPDHPLASMQGIPLKRLAEETFILREEGSGTRQTMERIFAEQGLAVPQGMQMTRNEAVKQAVRAGLGISVVSLHTIELELETARLAVLDAAGFPCQRHWYLVWRCGKRLSPAGSAFRDLVMREAAELIAPNIINVPPRAVARSA